MERITKEFEFGLGHTECYEACGMCLTVECGSFCTGLQEMLKKLAHYEDLEEQGYKMVNTDKVVGQLLKNAYKVTEKNTNLEHSVIGLIDVIKIVKGGGTDG